MSTVGIIGGGASGMVAAIAAARNGHKVFLFEHNDKLGKKLYATGNGKCNLTNRRFPTDCYRGGSQEFVDSVLAACADVAIERFFEGLGLLLKEKNGYVYPMSEQAASVVDVLCFELRRLGVAIRLQHDVIRVRRTKAESGYGIQCTVDGEERNYTVDAVVLACGGLAGQNLGASPIGYRIAEDFGHTVTKLYPALVPLCVSDKTMKSISGVRLEACVQLRNDLHEGDVVRERGEMLFADYGISGIPVMQLSRYASQWLAEGKTVTAVTDFLPDIPEKRLLVILKEHFHGAMSAGRTAEEAVCGMLPKKLMYRLLCRSGIRAEQAAGKVDEMSIARLCAEIKGAKWTISGTRPYEYAQVTAGGVELSEVNPQTMESKLVKGFYLTGELLDVDGTCGGYNLQWAFGTGLLAGEHIR